ncbi:hypothetical protein [Thermaurantiacus sp.]
MALALVSTLLALLVVLALNRGFLGRLGWARSGQMLLAWAVILLAVVLVARWLGLA